jgi:hypothetical protein
LRVYTCGMGRRSYYSGPIRLSATQVAEFTGAANIYFQTGKHLYFSAPVLVGWGIVLVVVRHRLKTLWPNSSSAVASDTTLGLPTAPRSPWQNPYVERLIGSVRRECLDHIIVWNQRSLRRTLQSYFSYYQRSRTHLTLAKNAPESRVVEKPEHGRVVASP